MDRVHFKNILTLETDQNIPPRSALYPLSLPAYSEKLWDYINIPFGHPLTLALSDMMANGYHQIRTVAQMFRASCRWRGHRVNTGKPSCLQDRHLGISIELKIPRLLC